MTPSLTIFGHIIDATKHQFLTYENIDEITGSLVAEPLDEGEVERLSQVCKSIFKFSFPLYA